MHLRYEYEVKYQKSGDSDCFCNTDLCNGPVIKKVGDRYFSEFFLALKVTFLRHGGCIIYF